MKTTFTLSKKKFRTTLLALLLALLAMPTSLWADDQAYVHFSDDGTIMTFRYDEDKLDGDYSIGDYIAVSDNLEVPQWMQDSKIQTVTKVVFDASFADARPATCSCWFWCMTSLKDIEGMNYLNTSEVTNMYAMFAGCTSLTSLDLSSFDTHNVDDMSEMFDYCTALTSINFSSFNTSKVDCMYGMFKECTSLTTLDLTSFYTPKLYEINYMFNGCSSLASIFVSDGFVISDKCYGYGVFEGCTSLQGYDENKTDYEMANADNGYFLKIEKGATKWVGYDETTQTLSFHYDAQRNSASGDTYDVPTSTTDSPDWLTHKDDVEHVVIDKAFNYVSPSSCSNWFKGMVNLTSFDGLSYLNTLNVTDMSSMFDGCSSIASIDLSPFNTANVVDMSRMFADCSSLTTIYVGDKFTVADDCKGDDMFKSCTKLPNYDDTKTGKEMATLRGYFTKKAIMWVEYQEDNKTLTFRYDNKIDDTDATCKFKVSSSSDMPKWYTSNYSRSVEKVVIDPTFAEARPTTCNSWFFYMDNLTDIEGLENLNTSETTDFCGMFWYCSKLTEIDLSHFNTSKVTDMNEMFGYCKSLQSLDISHFDTRNVNDMQGMFRGCMSLSTLDLSNFNTEKVTNMSYMFYECIGLQTLDLSTFRTENVTDMKYMFYRAEKLQELDLSNFSTEKVTDMSCMLYECLNLGKIDLSNFNTSKVTNMEYLFFECKSLKELDLHSFDTSASTKFKNMFARSWLLDKIYVSDNFTVTGESTDMFDGCTSLPGYDASKVDGSMANYTTGYLLKKFGSNGNEILSAKSSTLTIDDLQLSDDKPFVLYEGCKATKASYSRSMTSTWGTLCLPYAIDATAESNNCKFYELQSVGENVIWLKELEGSTIAAGTPVLVKKNDNQASITFAATDADLVTAPVTAESGNRLVGTFSGEVLKDAADRYFIANDHFYRVSDYSDGNGVKVKPFRAYLQTTSVSCASQLRLDGDTNGIDATAIADTLNDSATECYDVNGRRTTGIQKGLNIVRLGNGKTMKVFVK